MIKYLLYRCPMGELRLHAGHPLCTGQYVYITLIEKEESYAYV